MIYRHTDMTNRTYYESTRRFVLIGDISFIQDFITRLSQNTNHARTVSLKVRKAVKIRNFHRISRLFVELYFRKYNGPIISDRSSKNYREHGKIQQESEKETTP